MLSLALIGSVAADPNLSAQLDAYIAPYVKAGLVSGTVLAVKGSKVHYHKAFGMASVEFSVKNRVNTPFCIASVTKPMTISVILQLLEEKKLAVSDTVSKFLPEFPAGDKITITHLLNHRGGIAHRVTTSAQEVQPQDARGMAALAAKSPSIGTPGEKSIYSSAGFSVLARIAELVEDRPYNQILHTRIFKPSRMRDSWDTAGYSINRNRADGYTIGPNGLLPVPPKDLSFLVGAGSVNSTPMDLLRFLNHSLSGGYGKYNQANLTQGDRVFWNGITSGYRTFLDHDIKSGWTIVFCGNTTTAFADRLRADFHGIAAGKSPPARSIPRPNFIPVSERDLAEVAGLYRDDRTTKYEMNAGPGFLMLGDSVLIPVEKDRYFSYRDFGDIRVERTEGKVSKIVWTTELGGSLTLLRD